MTSVSEGTGVARLSNATGLMLAGAILAAWLAIHFAAIFLWEWTLASALLAVPVILVQAWLSTGLFIVAHDSMHGSLAPGRPRVNHAIGTLCLGVYAGLSFGTLLPQHHAHHRHSGTADDPDFHADAAHLFWPWFVRFFRTYYTHGQIVRITIAAIVYMLLGASLVNIVVFWAIPALVALTQLFVFGTWLPHRHDDTPFADTHHARSTPLAPLASLLTCFHFGGYHHEHHLSPGTPWFRLPSVRRRTDRPATQPAGSAPGVSIHPH